MSHGAQRRPFMLPLCHPPARFCMESIGTRRNEAGYATEFFQGDKWQRPVLQRFFYRLDRFQIPFPAHVRPSARWAFSFVPGPLTGSSHLMVGRSEKVLLTWW